MKAIGYSYPTLMIYRVYLVNQITLYGTDTMRFPPPIQLFIQKPLVSNNLFLDAIC